MQGSGVGLVISRFIVESHGGRLWATANRWTRRNLSFHLADWDTRVIASDYLGRCALTMRTDALHVGGYSGVPCIGVGSTPGFTDVFPVLPTCPYGWKHGRRTMVRLLGVLVFLLLHCGCRTSRPKPIALTYFRLGWSQPDDLPSGRTLPQQFTRETGVQLSDLPLPEATLDQLYLSRKLLQEHKGDVFNIDVIWPGIVGEDLVDLRHDLAEEITSIEPQVLARYELDGKLVAIPYTVQIGFLEYRSDLLREYGYQHPPRSWDELERMAVRIQSGERSKGKKDFWGYVWQGAATEALACNALEWQAAEAGGRIVESNRTISVNNPAAIRSWQRAKHWIGWISPPSVLAYQEVDSINVFDKGEAAFNRVWGAAPITHVGLFRQLHSRTSLMQSKTGYANIPGGVMGSAGTLGGSGLAVSRYSVHYKEAIDLVRFLIRAQIRSNNEASAAVTQPAIGNSSSASHEKHKAEESARNTPRLVIRPSSEAGTHYEQVTRAYIDAVHAVLTGEKSASEAAADIEKKLVQITGFKTGPLQRGLVCRETVAAEV
jgi:trehalose/maltose transport system substrate-binding protein